MDDSSFLAQDANLFSVDFSLVGHVALVGEDDEAHVGDCIFLDLDHAADTSFSQ